MQNNRIKLIFLICTFVFLLIIIKVFYSQVIEYRKLNTLAENLWSRNLPVGAERGRILDRNGKVIAGNVTTSTLVLIPNQIKNKEEVARNLASIIGVSYEEMYKHVSKKVSIERVHPEGRDLSYDVSEKLTMMEFIYLKKQRGVIHIKKRFLT